MWRLLDRWAAARRIAPTWIVWAGIALISAVTMAVPERSPEIVITQGDLLLGDDRSMPPSDSEAWQPVSLPDFWYVTRPGVTGYAWYRLQVDVPAQPQVRQAVYVERLRNVGAFFVNGVEVGQYGEFGTPNPGTRPQLFEFAPTLLHPGRNTLHVRLWKPPGGWAGMLSPVYLGPQTLMQERLDSGHFWKTTAPACAIVVLLFSAFITLTLWVCRPRESIYGYFGLSALFRLPTAARPLLLLPPQWPDGPVWWVQFVTLQTFAVLTFMFALRYGGWRLPRIERVAWAWIPVVAVLDAVGLLGYDEDHPQASYEVYGDVVGALTWILPIAYSAVFVILARKVKTTETILLAVAFTAATALGMVDNYGRPFGENSWFPFRMVPVYLIVTWALMRRFARTLGESESLNTDLAARVESKRQELETNYHRLGELEKEQAVVAERARLMRDMHDGIGGQLISTLSLVETGEATKEKVAAALRECIDDLRLAIDSLEPVDEDLLPVLGNLRYRVEPRLKARGIELDWQVQDMPKLAYMTPQNVLHVLRILQEAFTNVLKHAGASRVSVATRCEGDRVLIDVADDGRGMADSGDRSGGHGLANMRRRAQALGGELLLKATARGTTVTLELPMGAAQIA